MSLNILMLMLRFLSILAVVCNHSQMLVRNNSTVVIRELSWIFPIYACVCVCVCMSCLFRFDEILLFFCYIFLRSRSLSFPFFFIGFFFLSRVFLLLSLVCSRTMIIVIREIYKFDDRPDNDASVQVYYRLSMRM